MHGGAERTLTSAPYPTARRLTVAGRKMWTRLNPRPELPLAVDSGSSSEDDCRNKQAPLDTAEKKASRLLDQSEPPSICQLHDVFWMLPPRIFVRGPTGSGVKHVVFGAIPRGGNLAAATLRFPVVVRIFTRFLRQACPQHLFTTFVLRQGCFGKPHRDRRNSVKTKS